ncbi:N-acetyltransferase family 8 member 3-like [Pholidichthys leucotaenia]
MAMKVVIRQFRPSDLDSVQCLFMIGQLEQIHPSFIRAMTSPLYVTITLTLSIAGYLLGSIFGAVLLPAAWVSLIYYSCHTIFNSYVRMTLQADMGDISGFYLSRPDHCFWVAEAEVNGRAQVVGIVAVVARENGGEKYGKLSRLVVSPQCRRLGLGCQLIQTVVDFSKDRGFSKVELVTTSIQEEAVALYKKLGFKLVLTHVPPEITFYYRLLARIRCMTMEKRL